MYEKVEWFLQHGDNTVLFINGHNGHIGKSSVAGYTCLGELLSDNLGNGYYSIGTDAQETQFNSQKGNGEFAVLEVSNSNDLNNQFSNADNGQYFIDFASATSDEVWEQILSSEQSITTLNVSLSGMQKMLKSAYTVTITPQDICMAEATDISMVAESGKTMRFSTPYFTNRFAIHFPLFTRANENIAPTAQPVGIDHQIALAPMK